MGIDERFDDLVVSLVGFYRTWVVHLGLDLGLFERLRAAGAEGSSADELAEAAGAAADPVAAWCRAAYAAGFVDERGGKFALDGDVARILLDPDSPDYLGGQFSYSVTASFDYERLPGFLRTGRPVGERSPRYHRAMEQLTRQDIAVFFEQVLGAMPDLVGDLASGIDVVDLHCGRGRWLAAIAQRFPACRLVGIEAEPDSASRAMWRAKEQGLLDRIRIEIADVADISHDAAFDLAYFQHAFHEMTNPSAALEAAWRSLRPGGRLVVLGWALPNTLEEYASLHGQLIAGVALDELFHGARLRTADEHVAIFTAAGLPAPQVIPLPSDATLLVARKT